MGYCTITDVSALNQQRVYDATSNPTTTEVNSFIDWVYAEMNGRLSAAGFSVPVTATESAKILKMINALGAACMAERATFMGGEPNKSDHAETLCERYDNKMKAIEKNPNILYDAVTSTNKSDFKSDFTCGVTEEDADKPTNKNAVITSNMDF